MVVVAAAAFAVAACTAEVGAGNHGQVAVTDEALTSCVALDASGDAMLSNPPIGGNFGAQPILRVGGKDESLVRFDLGAIPSSAVIESAALKLYVSGSGSGAPVNVHRATSAWTESTVTYANFGQYFDAGVLGSVLPTGPNVQKSVDVTQLVTTWVTGAQPNFGVLLEANSTSRKTTFVSREGGTAEQKPALQVCYSVPDDHCSPNPCQHDATCENGASGYTCHCAPGYAGENCETEQPTCPVEQWQPTTRTGAPTARTGAQAVWTGSEMLVWGGYGGGGTIAQSGGRYDPVSDAWTATSTTGAPTLPASANVWQLRWTGHEAIVVGTSSAKYDPVTNSWTPIVALGSPDAPYCVVWTGKWLIGWGGGYASSYENTGFRYDPMTDTATPTSTTSAPTGRSFHSCTWTGREVIVFGGEISAGGNYVNTGGRYDPETDSWAAMTTSGAPSPRGHTAMAWTGRHVIVWGGGDVSGPTPGGALYDPQTNTWSAITGGPGPRGAVASEWTGRELIVWGGYARPGETRLSDGFRFDPEAGTWQTMIASAVPSARTSAASVWTGSEFIVWGGSPSDGVYLDTGAHYTPPAGSACAP